MEADDHQAALAAILPLLPDAGHRPGDLIAAAPESDLARLSTVFGRRPPADVVVWLRLCNGTFAGEGGIFGVPEIVQSLEFWSALRERGWLPIAGDGCGNLYIVDSNKDSAVGFFEPIADDTELQYYAASSLAIFLREWLVQEISRHDPDVGADFGAGVRWPFNPSAALAADPELANLHPLPWDA